MLFLNSKSRFFFNISILENVIFCLKKIFNFPKKSLNSDSFISKIYHKSDIYYLEHGRSAFYLFLSTLKRKTRKRKIIINSFTLFEMINMIIYSDFEPILVDLKNNSLDTNLESEIKNNKDELAAVVITHLNGFNKDIFQVKKVIDQINQNNDEKIFLVEDCAVSLGAKKNSFYTGSLGDYSILSFNIMKNITTLTGGALIDNYKGLDINLNLQSFENKKKISSILQSGFVFLLQVLNSKIFFPFFFQFIKLSYRMNFSFFLKKYRTDFKVFTKEQIPKEYLEKMDPLKEELLLKQLPKLKEDQSLRILKAKIYYDKLKKFDCFIFPQTDFDDTNIFIDFPILCKSEDLKNFIWKKSLTYNIDIKNYYYTNCGTHSNFKKYCKDRTYLNSKNIEKKIFMLPVNKSFNEKDINKIIKFLSNCVDEKN